MLAPVTPQESTLSQITDAMNWLWQQLHTLEPSSELGGIYANKPGYHNTRNANSPSNYSVVDGEDKGGPGDKAAAIDWTFPEAQHGDYSRIKKYSGRLLASGQDMNDPRLDGWREFYGQADGDSAVEGWDYRYVRPVSSDSSHLWHIHLSEDRDKTESYDNKKNLLSVLRGETVEQWRNGDSSIQEENVTALPNVVGQTLVMALPEGAKKLYLACDHGAAKIRAWFQRDYVGGWEPFTGQWVDDDGIVSISSAQPRNEQTYGLADGTGKLTFELMSVAAPDAKRFAASVSFK